ncbi:hypothetical protein K501DRAFT_275809 [Backusella circina FSU 941]|nr:hypothetical protein K501DRAFT_275809 [Backusella circina FSU 941]
MEILYRNECMDTINTDFYFFLQESGFQTLESIYAMKFATCDVYCDRDDSSIFYTLLSIERTSYDGDEDEKPLTKSQKMASDQTAPDEVYGKELQEQYNKESRQEEQRDTGSISYDEVLARELQRQFDEEMYSGEHMTGPSRPSTAEYYQLAGFKRHVITCSKYDALHPQERTILANSPTFKVSSTTRFKDAAIYIFTNFEGMSQLLPSI